MANKYRKALKILKSNTIDEKIKNLEESLPLNHTKGLYSLNAPGFRVGLKDPEKVYYPAADGTWPEGIPGTPGELEYIRPAGYWGGGSDWGTQITTDFSQDYLETDPTGRSTDTLIGADGTVFSALPPGGESFILGPIVDGFVPNHTSDAYTNIGYIQKDTRQFVLLGRIGGQWKSGLNGSYNVWNGTSTGFTSYNQNFTLEMAQWVRDKILADAYVSKVPYFYSGGVPQVPQSPADCPNCPPGMYGGNGVAPRQFGEGGNPSIGTEQDPARSGDEKDAGFPWEILGKVGDTIKDLLGVPDAIKDIAKVLKNTPEVINDIVKAIDELTQIDEYVEQTFGKLGNNVAIAVSNLTNRPVNITQDQISPRIIQDFANRLTPDLIGNDIPVNSGVVPYIDDNIRVDSRTGRVEPNTWDPSMPWSKDLGGLGSNTSQVDPAVKNPGSGPVNPITTAGQAQVQIVVPKDGSPPYLKYVDHAYANSKSTDANEFPGATETIYNIVNSIGDILHRKDNKNPSGVNSNMPNYGGMAGYPPNIRGDAVTTFDIPITNLPTNVQREINNKINSGNFNNSTFGDYSNYFNSTKASTARSAGGFKTVKEETKVKKILRDIKKPVVVPEIPKQKYKMNFSGKYSAQNTPDKTTSKLSDDLVASGNARGQRWRAEDKYWQGYETTERMNIIFDRVGHGDQYWDEIVNENMRKNSWKTKEMQEHLNIMAHEKAMKEENPNYDSPFYKEFIEEQETVQADKDPLFKKVAKRLKKEIDYLDKPSKNGVPNEPPPEMVNGYHPDFGKRKNYYNKLDPQSAEAMPETGDDEIDAQVKAARKKPK